MASIASRVRMVPGLRHRKREWRRILCSASFVKIVPLEHVKTAGALSRYFSTTTERSNKSNNTEESIRALLSLVDPPDAAIALDIINSARQHEQGGDKDDAITLAGVANLFLLGAVKSNERHLLDKAFEYIGRMRTVVEPRAVPSLSARNELIRACGREIRRIRQVSPKSGRSSILASSRVDGGASHQAIKHYLSLAEGLFDELRLSSVSHHQHQRDATVLHGRSMAVSSMIYVYCQAACADKALSVYDGMAAQGIRPDRWAAAGLIKSLASEGRASEAVELLERMEREGQGILQHSGMYLAILTSIVDKLQSRPPLAKANELRALCTRIMGHMRARGVQPTRRVWQRMMQGEAATRRPREVKRLMNEMDGCGIRVTPAEYCILIEALGWAGDVPGIDKAVEEMRRRGLSMTHVVYLCLIGAYGRCRDVGRGRQTFDNMRSHPGLCSTLNEYTSIMKVLTEGGLYTEAWHIFQDCVKRHQPDLVLCSVALRTAVAVGGVELMEKTFDEFVKQQGDQDDEQAVEDDLEAEPNVTFDVPKVTGLKDASYKPLTGEEDETCVLQIRAKLYRLTEVKKTGGGAAAESLKKKDDDAAEKKPNGEATPPQVRRDWVECGVGPAKILVAKSVEGEGPPGARVVMRREPGTSVILNARLRAPVEVAKHADKALRITCFNEANEPATYLLRFKQNDEAEQLLKECTERLMTASSSKESKA